MKEVVYEQMECSQDGDMNNEVIDWKNLNKSVIA